MTTVTTEAKLAEPGRRERRRAETREKLYQAAMQLFAEHGFYETTTEEITEAADVGQGTFFNYFPTKQHVLTVLSEKQLEKVMTAREEVESGNSSMQDVLHRLIHRIVEEPGRSQPLARSLLTALISNEDVRAFVRNTMSCGREVMAGIAAAGQQRGEIRSDRQPLEIALAFQRNVIGTLLLWAMQPQSPDPQSDLHHLLEAAFRDFWSASGSTPEAEKQSVSAFSESPATRGPLGKRERSESRREQSETRRERTKSSSHRKTALTRNKS